MPPPGSPRMLVAATLLVTNGSVSVKAALEQAGYTQEEINLEKNQRQARRRRDSMVKKKKMEELFKESIERPQHNIEGFNQPKRKLADYIGNNTLLDVKSQSEEIQNKSKFSTKCEDLPTAQNFEKIRNIAKLKDETNAIKTNATKIINGNQPNNQTFAFSRNETNLHWEIARFTTINHNGIKTEEEFSTKPKKNPHEAAYIRQEDARPILDSLREGRKSDFDLTVSDIMILIKYKMQGLGHSKFSNVSKATKLEQWFKLKDIYVPEVPKPLRVPQVEVKVPKLDVVDAQSESTDILLKNAKSICSKLSDEKFHCLVQSEMERRRQANSFTGGVVNM